MTTAALVVCMKNEGPFVLEWVAHHIASGFSPLIVFTNECTDGTDQLLDRLDDHGVVRHLENPNFLVGSNRRQHVANAYAAKLKEYKRAEYVGVIDADEFINIKVGNGRFEDLLEAAGAPEIVSLNHVNFGFGGMLEYRDVPLTEQFHLCGARHGGKTAIKTIHKNDPRIKPLNHYPHVPWALRNWQWSDGSGVLSSVHVGRKRPKVQEPGARTDLAQINHYALRSLESFLVKHQRGDGIGFEQFDGATYAEKYHSTARRDHSIERHAARTGEVLAGLLALPDVCDLHLNCVQHHRKAISDLRQSAAGKVLFESLEERFF